MVEKIRTFITERLFIEPLANKDSDFIFELLNTDGWIKFIGNRNINSNDDAVAYIEKIKENKNINYWTVNLKETNSSIGLVTLIKRDYLEHPDIGFAFLPGFYNKGYAYEAAKAVLTDLITDNTITNILAITLPGNNSSIRLLRKLGLSFDKEMERDKETLHIYSATAGKLLKK
jgi:RimJ/RimL family protein N-acetyltransferase